MNGTKTRRRGLVGEQGSQLIQTALQSSQHPTQGLVATVVSLAGLVQGALGVFGALQDALNTMWEVAPKPGLSSERMRAQQGMTRAEQQRDARLVSAENKPPTRKKKRRK